MRLRNKLPARRNTSFELRYNAAQNQWNVIHISGVLYTGSKRNCEMLIKNTESKLKQRKSKYRGWRKILMNLEGFFILKRKVQLF